jgi:transposase
MDPSRSTSSTERFDPEDNVSAAFRRISIASLVGRLRARPRMFQEIRAPGYTGSFSNLERLLARWRNPRSRTVKTTSTVSNPRPVDPATGRSISPIVAAALCIKPRGLLTVNQAAKVESMKEDWPEFATMRRLAMRFRGLLKSKSASKLGAWLRDAQKSGLYAMQRFARTAQRDIDAVRNAITEPWSNGQTEGQINRLKALKRTMYGRAGPELFRARLLPV